MASKESEEYFEKIQDSDRILALRSVIEFTDSSVPSAREVITDAFDAGVNSVNKRIGDVNTYYDQLNGMSEDYQAGYIQAEKDMPKQTEAAFEIIRLQKKLDALEEHNKWHRVDENPDDLPTEDKEYLVKVVFDVGTGNEHIFLAQWWNENKFWDSLYKDDIVAWRDIE